MSDSVQPHRQQPIKLLWPWDSPGKNTRVGCHFLLQCMKVKRESEVAQSCLTLSDPMDCSLPGSSVHGFSRQEYWSGVPLPSLRCITRTQVKQSFCSPPCLLKLKGQEVELRTVLGGENRMKEKWEGGLNENGCRLDRRLVPARTGKPLVGEMVNKEEKLAITY